MLFIQTTCALPGEHTRQFGDLCFSRVFENCFSVNPVVRNLCLWEDISRKLLCHKSELTVSGTHSTHWNRLDSYRVYLEHYIVTHDVIMYGYGVWRSLWGLLMFWPNAKLAVLNMQPSGKFCAAHVQFLAYFPNMNVGLSNHLSVCLSACPTLITFELLVKSLCSNF
jgi:hypothetical protein